MRSKLLIGLFLLVSAASAVSIYQLFALRFETGDIFPPGSSLRSDPLGSMAFYHALGQTGQLSPNRNYRPLSRQQLDQSTILLLGSSPQLLFQRKNAEQLDRLATAGNRVVIAFAPLAKVPTPATSDQDDEDEQDDYADQQPETAWGITTGLLPDNPQKTDGSMLRATLVDNRTALPPEALLISRLVLLPPASGWRTIYAVDGKAVLLERMIGKGSLVLVADSSIFSNEGLMMARQTALLNWLLGEHRKIIFDESHLGVTEQGGVMVLARRFGLLPLIGALLLLAGLYIWQQSIPLTPASPPVDSDPALCVSHDSFTGLVNLLRRNIPTKKLLQTCCREWSRSFSHELQRDSRLRTEIEEAMAAEDDPVGRYQRISRLWAERTKR